MGNTIRLRSRSCGNAPVARSGGPCAAALSWSTRSSRLGSGTSHWLYNVQQKRYFRRGTAKAFGHKRYDTVWLLIHKIREAMGKRDGLCGLKDEIEYDVGYFEIATKESKKKKLKRGRGSQKQSTVAVRVQSTTLEDPDTGKKSNHCRYFKMKVLDSHKAEEINDSVEGNFD